MRQQIKSGAQEGLKRESPEICRVDQIWQGKLGEEYLTSSCHESSCSTLGASIGVFRVRLWLHKMSSAVLDREALVHTVLLGPSGVSVGGI